MLTTIKCLTSDNQMCDPAGGIGMTWWLDRQPANLGVLCSSLGNLEIREKLLYSVIVINDQVTVSISRLKYSRKKSWRMQRSLLIYPA